MQHTALQKAYRNLLRSGTITIVVAPNRFYHGRNTKDIVAQSGNCSVSNNGQEYPYEWGETVATNHGESELQVPYNEIISLGVVTRGMNKKLRIGEYSIRVSLNNLPVRLHKVADQTIYPNGSSIPHISGEARRHTSTMSLYHVCSGVSKRTVQLSMEYGLARVDIPFKGTIPSDKFQLTRISTNGPEIYTILKASELQKSEYGSDLSYYSADLISGQYRLLWYDTTKEAYEPVAFFHTDSSTHLSAIEIINVQWASSTIDRPQLAKLKRSTPTTKGDCEIDSHYKEILFQKQDVQKRILAADYCVEVDQSNNEQDLKPVIQNPTLNATYRGQIIPAGWKWRTRRVNDKIEIFHEPLFHTVSPRLIKVGGGNKDFEFEGQFAFWILSPVVQMQFTPNEVEGLSRFRGSASVYSFDIIDTDIGVNLSGGITYGRFSYDTLLNGAFWSVINGAIGPAYRFDGSSGLAGRLTASLGNPAIIGLDSIFWFGNWTINAEFALPAYWELSKRKFESYILRLGINTSIYKEWRLGMQTTYEPYTLALYADNYERDVLKTLVNNNLRISLFISYVLYYSHPTR